MREITNLTDAEIDSMTEEELWELDAGVMQLPTATRRSYLEREIANATELILLRTAPEYHQEIKAAITAIRIHTELLSKSIELEE